MMMTTGTKQDLIRRLKESQSRTVEKVWMQSDVMDANDHRIHSSRERLALQTRPLGNCVAWVHVEFLFLSIHTPPTSLPFSDSD